MPDCQFGDANNINVIVLKIIAPTFKKPARIWAGHCKIGFFDECIQCMT